MAIKILFVTPFTPFETHFGAGQRTALLYDSLCALGDVDTVIIREHHENSVTIAPDENICAEILWKSDPFALRKYRSSRRITDCVEQALDRPLADYDLIVGRYLAPISKLALPSNTPTLVDLDDFNYSYGERSLNPKLLVKQFKGFANQIMGEAALSRFDAFFFVSPRIRAAYRSLRGEMLPNIPFTIPPEPKFRSEGKRILFIGALWYGPNKEGVDQFLTRVWPKIRAAEPEAELLLVGQVATKIRDAWSALPGVSAPGFVDDIAEAYADAAYTIAPIMFGGGSNIKMLEAMAHGRICVGTPYSVEPFLEHFAETGAMPAAPNEESFANTCIDLLRDPSECEKRAMRGYEVIKNHFSRTKFKTIVEQTIDAMAIS